MDATWCDYLEQLNEQCRAWLRPHAATPRLASQWPPDEPWDRGAKLAELTADLADGQSLVMLDLGDGRRPYCVDQQETTQQVLELLRRTEECQRLAAQADVTLAALAAYALGQLHYQLLSQGILPAPL